MKRREFLKLGVLGAVVGRGAAEETLSEEDLAAESLGTNGTVVIDRVLTKEDIVRIQDKWTSTYTGFVELERRDGEQA